MSDAMHREDTPAWDGRRFAQDQDTARLYVLIARDAPVAAVFRRGPGRQVALLRWSLEDDTVQLGQWFKGRIYERRCDLSPDGELLLYFAAKHSGPLYSWTALSTLPWLTAHCLWRKGDCWGGGGLFGEDGTISLNHRPAGPEPPPAPAPTGKKKQKKVPRYMRDDPVPPWGSGSVPAEQHGGMDIVMGKLPKPWRRVQPFGAHSGWGEDEPIWPQRLLRDGWTCERRPERIDIVGRNQHSRYVWQTDGALVWRKNAPDGTVLGMKDDEHGEVGGRSYLTECLVSFGDAPERTVSYGRVDWADFHGGALLFARNGCLWRSAGFGREAPALVADLTPLRFEIRLAPYEGARRTGYSDRG